MFLVVFRNCKAPGIDHAAYEADAARMQELASRQPGYISFKSYVADDGEVVAVSQWASEDAAREWGRNAEHLAMQAKGRDSYYESYTLFACADPRTHSFERTKK